MNIIKVKRSAVSNRPPAASEIEEGQLAINSTDRMIYTKNPAGVIVPLTRTLSEIWTYILSLILPVSAGGTGNNTLTKGGLLLGNGTDPIQSATPSLQNYVIKAAVVNGTLVWTQDYALSYWAEAFVQTSPNASVAVASITPRSTAVANVDASIAPKGSGALLTQVPDDTISNGSKRGLYAVDFQRVRTAASQIASGANATVLNGSGNTASGVMATVVNGTNNVADGYQSIILTGNYVTSKGVLGGILWGGNGSTALGQCQSSMYSLSAQTVGVVTVRATVDRGAASASNQICLNTGSAMGFSFLVVAIDLANSYSASFIVQGTATRFGAASTLTVVTATTVLNNSFPLLGALISTVTAVGLADVTNGCLGINVTGYAGSTLRWAVTANIVEVSR